MINLLTPPIFDNEDKTLVARYIHIILWTFIAVGWLPLFIAVIIPETVYRWLLFFGVGEVAGFILLVLNKYGHSSLASSLMIFIIWTGTTVMALTGGGVSSNAMSIYLLIVLIATLVKSGKAGFITAVLCSLTGLFLVYIEYSGALPANQVSHTPLTKWIANTIYMIIIISLQYLFSRTIGNALKQSRQELKERKKAEEAQREGDGRYQSLVENASDIIFKTDNTGHFTFGNQAAQRITGYKAEELNGMHYSAIVRPDMCDEIIKFFGRQFVKRIQNTYSEYPIITKDGHEVWFGQNTQLIVEDGNVTGFQVISRDITDRKRAEEALRKSEERYKSLVENANETIMVIQDGMIKFVNSIASEAFGYSEQEFLSIPVFELVHPEDRDAVIQRYLQKINGDSKPTRYIYRGIHKSGQTQWIEIGSALIDWEGKPATLNLITNITERKQAEKQLQDTLKSLRMAVGTTIQVMVSTVEAKDPYTAGHQVRSANLAGAIATEMGLSQDKIEGIRMAGSIHDIGKIAIPTEILTKATKLSEIEFLLIKEHSLKGYEILKDIESSWPLAEIVYQHHERMDGSGYPRKLKIEEILMEARILAVADVVEAMASHRPYRPALGIDAALEEIEKKRGTLYDDDVVTVCLRLFREKGFKLGIT